MPRKKQNEVEMEQEIDTSTKVVKKETFATKWFNEYAVNNKKELKILCDLTAESADTQFSLSVRTDNTEVFGVIFYATFITILEFIRSKEATYNEFTIEIGNSINIGYTNNDNDENEKVGNFMPILEFIGINRNLVDIESSIDANRTVRNYLRWKELNVKKNVEYCKEIQEKASEILKRDYKTDIRSSEAIIPLFCIFMDHITNVLKQKFNEADGTDVSEVSINVFGLFDAYYSYDEEEDKEIIEFQPNITMKLALKADDVASRGN